MEALIDEKAIMLKIKQKEVSGYDPYVLQGNLAQDAQVYHFICLLNLISIPTKASKSYILIQDQR